MLRSVRASGITTEARAWHASVVMDQDGGAYSGVK